MPGVFGRRLVIHDVAGNAEGKWRTGISDADLGQNKLLEHSLAGFAISGRKTY